MINWLIIQWLIHNQVFSFKKSVFSCIYFSNTLYIKVIFKYLWAKNELQIEKQIFSSAVRKHVFTNCNVIRKYVFSCPLRKKIMFFSLWIWSIFTLTDYDKSILFQHTIPWSRYPKWERKFFFSFSLHFKSFANVWALINAACHKRIFFC